MKKTPSLRLTPEASGQSRTLQAILSKAEHHRRAEATLLAALPEALREGVRFVSSHEGDLVLSAPTSVTASQLRMRQHEILSALREADILQFAWRLTIRVRPGRHQPAVNHPPRTLSNENARLLEEEAGHTKDKALREVLEKLASHTQR